MAYVYGCQLSKNIIMLNVISGEPRPGIDTGPKLWQDLNNALPIRFRNIIIAQTYNPNKHHLLDFMGYQVQRTTEFKSQRQLIRIAAPSSAALTLQLLETHGLPAQCVPHCLGGEYDYQQFHDWIRMRLSVEDVMSSAPIRYHPCGSTVAATTAPHVARLTSVPKRGTLARAMDDLTRHKYNGTNVSQRILARERNALYSRRSFNKKKLEQLALENERDLLLAQNQKLRLENEALQAALEKAHHIVQTWHAKE